MINSFPKALRYLTGIDISKADGLDKIAKDLVYDEAKYERASQALRRRFVRGAETVDGIDRGGRTTKIKRDQAGGKYKYTVLGADGNWFEPEERIWVVSMYALWQSSK
jgi:hypothetical protein